MWARPSVHIISPTVAKFDTTIPDTVLDAVYGNLPDKQKK